MTGQAGRPFLLGELEMEIMYAQGQQAKSVLVEANGYGAIGIDPDKREAELPAEMNRLAKAIEFVDHGLNELHARLEGRVIRPSVPQPAGGNEAKLASVGPATGYGQELHNYGRRVNELGERVQDLLRRLEV